MNRLAPGNDADYRPARTEKRGTRKATGANGMPCSRQLRPSESYLNRFRREGISGFVGGRP
jgi:hypothetical protein